MNEEKDYMEFDIIQMLTAVLHRWWIILIASFVCAGAMFGYTKFLVTPMYTSNILMYVNNSSSVSIGSQSFGLSASDLSAAKTLVDTYCIILDSRLTLEEVLKEGNLDMSYDQLRNSISAQAVNETEVFSVKVTDSDPQRACLIANTIAKVLPEKIPNVVEGSSVKTVDYAVVGVKVSPSVIKDTVIGAVVGIVLAVGILFHAAM